MDLDDRKLKILNAIVTDYILTAEPIGSRTIEKKYNLGVSAATIRNEMSDLEDLGLIIAPHASAGRVPSDKGYRLYVDNIVSKNDGPLIDMSEVSNLIKNNVNKIEDIMEQTAKIIANCTNYATVIKDESFIVYRIKRLQLVPIDEKHVLLVMIFDKNVVRNEHLFTNGIDYHDDYLQDLTMVLNKYLANMLIDEVTQYMIEDIISYMSEKYDLDDDIIKQIISKIFLQAKDYKDTKVYKYGVNNILEYPEFYNNASKAKDIFESIEQKDFIYNLLEDEMSEGFQIIIGEENDKEAMKDLTVMKARYKISEDRYGSIGIIAPKRMNYEQTISVLNEIVRNISAVVKSLE